MSAGRRGHLESRVRNCGGKIPVGELCPELWFACGLLVGDDHALRQRLVAIGHPDLEIHRIRARSEMMRRRAKDARLLHIIDRFHAPLQLCRQLTHQQHGERQTHAKILDEMNDAVIQSAGLRGRCIDVARSVDQHDFLAIENGQRPCSVAAFPFEAQAIRAAQGHLAGLAKFDLLARRLHRIVVAMDADAEALRGGQKIRHAHQDGICLYL